jgi:peroxiredoxin
MNMKRIGFFVAIGVLLASCSNESNENAYKVSGTIEGVDEGEVVLQKYDASGTEAIDSAKIVDGSFSFSGSIDYPQLHFISVNDNQGSIAFFLESGDIRIDADSENLQDADIKGSELTTLFEKFNNEMPYKDRNMEIRDEYNAAREAGEEDKMQQLSKEFQDNMAEQQQYFHDFAFSNTDNVVGAFMAMNLAGSLEFPELEKLVAEYEENISGGHPYVTRIKEMMEPMRKQMEARENTRDGNVAPDFTLTDKDGNEKSLSDFQGKYVFLDFWASWCRPCRNENPNLIKAYEQYGGEDFEIVGVSLDKTKDPWIKAIEDDNITWMQLHDPNGEVATEYGVESIPFTILLDKEGVVIAKNLRGEALQNKLDELL